MSRINVQNLDLMIATALTALEAEGSTTIPLIDGRVVAVFATPEDGTSSDIAMGVSALPAGYSTPEHTHRAEEIATVVHGSGTIVIEDEPFDVSVGSIVVTPPHARHTTTAGPDSPLAVYWQYAPAGSEKRWLADRD